VGTGENVIIPFMFLRSACVLTLVLGAVVGAGAMPVQSPVVIDDDVRVFTVVVALNVSGFDVELGPQYHPARAEIRKVADSLDPDLLRRMKDFYDSHKGGAPDEDQLAKYISLAVILTDPPALKPIAREEGLPDDARSVLGFVPLLQEFYQKAGITRLWARVGPYYESEMDRIGPPIREAILRTDSYLRISAGRSLQTMKVSVELGAPLNSINIRSQQDEYFVILGYASRPKVDDVRHAYLHLRLNNTAALAAAKVESRAGIMTLLFNANGVEREYATSFENMLTESLVRAVELRIDRVTPAAAEESLKVSYRSGLLLTPYFYESLPTYESGDNSFRDELPTLAAGIDGARERDRFEKTFNSIPVPQRQVVRGEVPVAPPPPPADPVLELLRAAQAVFDTDKPRARENFERVLKEHDPNNGRALYGIGLIEMDKQNLDEALQYFDRTIKSVSADRSMKTWSYIYSGHILDFKCNRAAALENYRKAIETGDNTRDAQTVARRDLAQPFGGECRQ